MSNTWTYLAPCHFGTEAVCKRELTDLGAGILRVEDGRIFFTGGPEMIARANLFLRTTERVLLVAGEFTATTFDELFEATRALPWEQWIPPDGRFWVTKANSVSSRLFSPSDIQRIMKKAMVERLKSRYGIEWFPETGASFPLRVSIRKDRVTVGIDTSGESLHKRGYRKLVSAAPIAETLAAALIMLTPWHADRILVDPFCGSGTIPIEAALMAANIAPGLERSFTAEDWTELLPKKAWYDAASEAEDRIRRDVATDIQGYDIDGAVVAAARENARRAGVEHLIHFQQRPVAQLSHPKPYGFLITNPPYGERIEEKAALPELYRTFGERFSALSDWSAYVITAYDGVERDMGRKAEKNRKIYNGMMKTYFYQFPGPRPPKRPRPAKEAEND